MLRSIGGGWEILTPNLPLGIVQVTPTLQGFNKGMYNYNTSLSCACSLTCWQHLIWASHWMDSRHTTWLMRLQMTSKIPGQSQLVYSQAGLHALMLASASVMMATCMGKHGMRQVLPHDAAVCCEDAATMAPSKFCIGRTGVQAPLGGHR